MNRQVELAGRPVQLVETSPELEYRETTFTLSWPTPPCGMTNVETTGATMKSPDEGVSGADCEGAKYPLELPLYTAVKTLVDMDSDALTHEIE